MGIFDKRVAFKPFEYNDIVQYKNAINHSYWLVTEWNFIGDVQDFNVALNDIERSALKNALLAISQIEVSVKKFWTNLGNHFPKAEFEQVGVTFGESEVRHSDAYSHLLQVLGMNEDFEALLGNHVIQGRVNYLTKYLKGNKKQKFSKRLLGFFKKSLGMSDENAKRRYLFTLALFSIFVENVSLFAQFVVIKSFNKHKNVLKDIDNVVQATQKEEVIHAMFGMELINMIKKEYPEWFDAEFYAELKEACIKAFEAESDIIDWIFEAGELEFLKAKTLKEFIKGRLNKSLEAIGGEAVFDVDQNELDKLKWFDEEINAEVSVDFFYKKSTAYSKRLQPITADDLFPADFDPEACLQSRN